MVAAGLAVFKRAPQGAVDYRQILKTGRKATVPRAQTIQAGKWWETVGYPGTDVPLRGQIERAFVDERENEKERIERYEKYDFPASRPTGKTGEKELKRIPGDGLPIVQPWTSKFAVGAFLVKPE